MATTTTPIVPTTTTTTTTTKAPDSEVAPLPGGATLQSFGGISMLPAHPHPLPPGPHILPSGHLLERWQKQQEKFRLKAERQHKTMLFLRKKSHELKLQRAKLRDERAKLRDERAKLRDERDELRNHQVAFRGEQLELHTEHAMLEKRMGSLEDSKRRLLECLKNICLSSSKITEELKGESDCVNAAIKEEAKCLIGTKVQTDDPAPKGRAFQEYPARDYHMDLPSDGEIVVDDYSIDDNSDVTDGEEWEDKDVKQDD